MSALETPLDFPLGGTGDTAPAYARMLTALLPPGRVWRFVGSVLERVLLACADELERLHDRAIDLVNESDPSTAAELLPEYESELGLVAASTSEERRANIVARQVARQRVRPVDFKAALAPLLALDPDDVVVIERTPAQAAGMGDPREIFRFFIYRDPGLPGTYFVASAQALVDKMAPSHTIGTVIESIDAEYDDPNTLYDRDILGA